MRYAVHRGRPRTPAEEADDLRRQLRLARERLSQMFDHGFEAATRMAEAGATPERLREASGVPHALASETTDVDWEADTDVGPIPSPVAP